NMAAPTAVAIAHREWQRPRRKFNWALSTIVIVGTVILTVGLGGAILLQRRWAASRAVSPVADLPLLTIPLTSFPDEELDPALSPDGKFVAYTWKGGVNKGLNIYVQQVDGGTPV